MKDTKILPVKLVRGAKRLNVTTFRERGNVLDRMRHKKTCPKNDIFFDTWYVGYGKDEGCEIEGTWWDWICLARNILASENTKIVAPEFYKPELKNDNY